MGSGEVGGVGVGGGVWGWGKWGVGGDKLIVCGLAHSGSWPFHYIHVYTHGQSRRGSLPPCHLLLPPLPPRPLALRMTHFRLQRTLGEVVEREVPSVRGGRVGRGEW